LRALVSEHVYEQFREADRTTRWCRGEVLTTPRFARFHHAGFLRSAVTTSACSLFSTSSLRWGRRRPCAPESTPPTTRFTGFVFKIQANMDPATEMGCLVRVCSGEFARDMTVRNARTGDQVRSPGHAALCRRSRVVWRSRTPVTSSDSSTPVLLRSATRSTKAPASRSPHPGFAPEHFASVRSIDVSGYKSFGKGISQLREGGSASFLSMGYARIEPILGAVGELQFRGCKIPAGIRIQRQDARVDSAILLGALRRRRPRSSRARTPAVQR